MNCRKVARASMILLVAFALNMVVSNPANAQWVAPRGEGSFSIEYQRIRTGDHLYSDIFYLRDPLGTTGHQEIEVSGDIMVLDVDYAIYDRLGLNVSIPFISTEYVDEVAGSQADFEHHAGAAEGIPDSGFQDFRVNLRYMFLTNPVFATAGIGFDWPSHDYPSYGHVAIGQNLKRFNVGLTVGRALYPILPQIYVEGRYSYTVPEKVLGISHNRSNARLGITYSPLDFLSIDVAWLYQNTHGGIDWSEPGLATHPEWYVFNDLIAEEDYQQIGGAISFYVTDWLGLYAGYFSTIDGVSANVQHLHGDNFGTTTSF